MSNPTTNYGLIKAADSEPYDVDITNNNLDAIDTQLKTVENLARKAKNARFFTLNPKPAPVAGNGYTYGPLSVDPGKPLWTQGNDFCEPFNSGTTVNDTGRIRITKAGFYHLSAGYMPQGNPGNINFALSIQNNSAGNEVIPMSRVGTYGDWGAYVSVNGVYLSVGTTLEGYQANANAVSFSVWLNVNYAGE